MTQVSTNENPVLWTSHRKYVFIRGWLVVAILRKNKDYTHWSCWHFLTADADLSRAIVLSWQCVQHMSKGFCWKHFYWWIPTCTFTDHCFLCVFHLDLFLSPDLQKSLGGIFMLTSSVGGPKRHVTFANVCLINVLIDLVRCKIKINILTTI